MDFKIFVLVLFPSLPTLGYCSILFLSSRARSNMENSEKLDNDCTKTKPTIYPPNENICFSWSTYDNMDKLPYNHCAFHSALKILLSLEGPKIHQFFAVTCRTQLENAI